ncbi:MAG: FRG domain-containing protein [Microscillaceae bacterium]|nr:FRG domain-containing protein [Microscillaceae bacterium]
MPNDLHVQNWAELQEALFHDAYEEKLRRYRSPYVYRGLGQARYDLKTSLMRLGGNYGEVERHLIRNFRKYAKRITSLGNIDSFWDTLAIAQHFGLPTRLLDWTYSPYVALHFATAKLSQFEQDGIIWAVNHEKVIDFLPDALKERLQEEGSNKFTTDLLNPVCKSWRDFDTLQEERFVIFFEPPSFDDRIVNQFALFSAMSDVNGLLNEWLTQHPDLYFRIIIPAALKWEVRDKLDQANINERVLFPGLEGLSTWLKRHYSPRYPGEAEC